MVLFHFGDKHETQKRPGGSGTSLPLGFVKFRTMLI
jgi:hypothetical protein